MSLTEVPSLERELTLWTLDALEPTRGARSDHVSASIRRNLHGKDMRKSAFFDESSYHGASVRC